MEFTMEFHRPGFGPLKGNALHFDGQRDDLVLVP
jgi:hypothetical protein